MATFGIVLYSSAQNRALWFRYTIGNFETKDFAVHSRLIRIFTIGYIYLHVFGPLPYVIMFQFLNFFVAGLPGICSFYEQFAKCLHHKHEDLTICIVSHLHHDYDQVTDERNKFRLGKMRLDFFEIRYSNDSFFRLEHASLTDQVAHKLEFIVKYIPQQSQLYLVGHSIGAYAVLHMLEDLIILYGYKVKYYLMYNLPKFLHWWIQVERCFLLFPVFEHLTKTTRGYMCNIACNLRLHYPLMALAGFLYYTPDFVKRWLITWRIKKHKNNSDDELGAENTCTAHEVPNCFVSYR